MKGCHSSLTLYCWNTILVFNYPLCQTRRCCSIGLIGTLRCCCVHMHSCTGGSGPADSYCCCCWYYVAFPPTSAPLWLLQARRGALVASCMFRAHFGCGHETPDYYTFLGADVALRGFQSSANKRPPQLFNHCWNFRGCWLIIMQIFVKTLTGKTITLEVNFVVCISDVLRFWFLKAKIGFWHTTRYGGSIWCSWNKLKVNY